MGESRIIDRERAEREIFSKSGPVSVEDLRRSYGDAIPGIVMMTATVLGITSEQVIDMARNGLLEYASLQEALHSAPGRENKTLVSELRGVAEKLKMEGES